MTPKLVLPPFLTNEGVGDWSGLKGSDYHLLVAVYLMLAYAREVSFYAGNDLHSIAPTPCPPAESATLEVSLPFRDEWVQTKNVADAWTNNHILSDPTLVLTFVLNALWSQRQGHEWGVKLVTTADIRSADVRNFLASFQAPRHARKSNEHRYYYKIVCKARAIWSAWAKSQGHEAPVKLADIDRLVKEALEQIAQCETTPIRHLTLAIENELLKQYPDTVTVRQIALALQGAIQKVGEAPAAQPVTFTLAWLEEQTGHPLVMRNLVPRNIPQACHQQVERSLPPDWTAAAYVSRTDLAAALEEFRHSDRSLFVLVGNSGYGKSWECATEAAERLRGQVRLLIRGSQLISGRSLLALIHEALADMARPNVTEEELFVQLHGAAVDSARGPFVLIADDIPLPSNLVAFEEALEARCQEAQRRGIKLALTARSGVWQRLSQGSRLAPYLFRRVITPDKPLRHSYELTRLTDSEMHAMLARLLPVSADVDRIALALRRTAFAALRNPYLLSIYVNQFLVDGQGRSPVAVDVDALLDAEAERRFGNVVRAIVGEPDELMAIKETLIAEMWRARRTGKPAGDLIRSLEEVVAGVGRKTLHALQSEDVLTHSGDIKALAGAVTYANPQLGDRLTAVWLTCRMRQGEDMLTEMQPGLDDGVMTALARQAMETVEADAIAWAEGVLKRDPGWLPALALGLAQRKDEDWRIPALLTAWSNRDEPYSAWNAMRALGDMAGHSSYARAWIAALYDDENETQSFKGQIALGAALDLAPSWVRRRMQLRLRRDLKRPAGFTMSAENREQARYLRGALQPLQAASHAEAAEVARFLLTRFQKQYRPPRDPEQMDVRETLGNVVDAIRGRIALFGSDADIANLVQELGSEDRWMRRAAARALLPVAEGQPEKIKDAVFQQARIEQAVLGDVPRLLYFYTESDPEAVVEVIQTGSMLRTRACGIALTLLARIARTHPPLFGRLLPERLDSFPGFARALLNEALAFAWWQYASQVPQDARARSVLEGLSVPADEDVEDKHRAFATHSASMAVLARIALDIEGMSAAAAEAPIIFHHLAEEMGFNFLYVKTQETCGRFAQQIALHPLFEAWRGLLCQTAREYAANEIHPIETGPSEWQFRVANLATDWLCACAPYIAGAATIVAALPPDWPLLRFCTALVQANRITPEITEQACQLCAKNINVEGNISGDRDRFLYALREAELLPPVYTGLLANRSVWAEARLSSLEADIRHAPKTLLETLHAHVNKENAAPILWEWASDATDWRSILLSHALRAMFSTAALTLRDCRCICDQALSAVGGLPDSRLVREYQAVYATLRAFCDRDKVDVPLLEFYNDLLSQSHRVALDIVRACQLTSAPLAETWFEDWVLDGEGWTHDSHHWLQNGRVIRGFGVAADTLYFPPALRVALAIVSLRTSRIEFVSHWIQEQSAVHELLSSGSYKKIADPRYRHYSAQEKEELLASALTEIEAPLVLMPRNACLHATKGNLLLLQNQIDQAQEVLQKCLTLPWYDARLLAGVHYDLACCYARRGESEPCRLALQQALPGLPHMGRKHVENDSDFISVLGEQWFLDLITPLPDLPYWG